MFTGSLLIRPQSLMENNYFTSLRLKDCVTTGGEDGNRLGRVVEEKFTKTGTYDSDHVRDKEEQKWRQRAW